MRRVARVFAWYHAAAVAFLLSLSSSLSLSPALSGVAIAVSFSFKAAGSPLQKVRRVDREEGDGKSGVRCAAFSGCCMAAHTSRCTHTHTHACTHAHTHTHTRSAENVRLDETQTSSKPAENASPSLPCLLVCLGLHILPPLVLPLSLHTHTHIYTHRHTQRHIHNVRRLRLASFDCLSSVALFTPPSASPRLGRPACPRPPARAFSCPCDAPGCGARQRTAPLKIKKDLKISPHIAPPLFLTSHSSSPFASSLPSLPPLQPDRRRS